MIGILLERLRLGHQTIAYPGGPARFPARFHGRPALHPARCAAGSTPMIGRYQCGSTGWWRPSRDAAPPRRATPL